MANRIIKESITTSGEIDKLTAEEERFFYRLIVVCDDFGRMDARPPVLRARCFPLKVDYIRDDDIKKWLDALVKQKLITVYTVNDKQFIQVITFEKHNSRRAKHSKYPNPQSGEIGCMQVHADVAETRESRHENRDTVHEKTATTADDFRKIIKVFESEIHPLPSPTEVEHLTAWLDDGMEADLIVWAIKQAAIQGKRSMSYINAILQNLHDGHITTLAGAEARERDRKKPTAAPPPKKKPLTPEERKRIAEATAKLKAGLAQKLDMNRGDNP